MSVVIETTLGDITVDLYLSERPRACLNFLKLCKLKYYNFNLFHTVEQGFIAQTGDPSGSGNEGTSVWGLIEGVHKRFFEAEYIPKIRHTEPGLLSMVSTGKNMIGSQFFFTLGSDLTSLDGIHCIIGEIAEGHDILRKINEAICDDSHRPYQDIRVTHTVVLDDPFENPRGFKEPSRSPSPTPERLKNGRIGADEQIDDTEGKTEEEIQEMFAAREAIARATILEIVGDLPDAEIAPPENVLFVCKLNPVTTDDDLEIIFSRFGKVKGCEVIRDKVSGDSLQYAFVEFEDKKSCEDAYFKMDNVLIDDRRIHVDFSQSVAKIKWKGKGRGIEYEDNRDANKKIDFSQNARKNYNKAVRTQERDDGQRRNDQHKLRRSPYKQKDYNNREYQRSTYVEKDAYSNHNNPHNFRKSSSYRQREYDDNRDYRKNSDKEKYHRDDRTSKRVRSRSKSREFQHSRDRGKYTKDEDKSCKYDRNQSRNSSKIKERRRSRSREHSSKHDSSTSNYSKSKKSHKKSKRSSS